MIPNRSFWRTPRGIITALVVALVLLGGGTAAFLLTCNNAPAQVGAPQTSSAPSADPSMGVKQYGADTPVDYQKQAAIEARHEYPEYYQCRTYPSDANLTPADLIPTDNVIATITYNASKGKYVVAGDPRITATEHDSTQPANSDFKEPALEQEFTFSFAPGVHYFNTYGIDAGGTKWSHSTSLYHLWGNDTTPIYELTVYVGDQKNWEQFVIIAMDTSTCAAGTMPLPAGFDWTYLATSGLVLPEFYTGGVHPQG